MKPQPFLLLTALLPVAGAASEPIKPNIIYILADDMGYGDVSALNPESKIKTEHLDRMADDGMYFTDAHTSSSVSTPSRYAILTGRYNWRSTLQSGVAWSETQPLIEPGRMTVATLLSRNGYHTACIGKWHLGLGWQTDPSTGKTDFNLPLTQSPKDNGFDYSYILTASLDIPPYVYIKNGRLTAPVTDTLQGQSGLGFWRTGPCSEGFDIHATLDHFTDKALDYIWEQAQTEEPFFLYFPLTAPHTPILPNEQFAGKSEIGAYGDFVMQVDDIVGQIVAIVEEAGIEQNTLIIFTSDNGCSPAADVRSLEAQGHYPSYIYRGYKADIYEGGHRVPFIVKYPSLIEPGSVSDVPICQTNLMSTCANMLDVALPINAGEDSFSMLNALSGNPLPEDYDQILIHHSIDGYFAIRHGEYKLCVCPGSGGWSAPAPGKEPKGAPPMQLFHLTNTPEEPDNKNLYTDRPEIAGELFKMLEKAIHDGGTRPGRPQKNDTEVILLK